MASPQFLSPFCQMKVTITASLQVPFEIELSKAKAKKLCAEYMDPDEKGEDLEISLQSFMECEAEDVLVDRLLKAIPGEVEFDHFTLKLNEQELDGSPDGVEVEE